MVLKKKNQFETLFLWERVSLMRKVYLGMPMKARKIETQPLTFILSEGRNGGPQITLQ